MKEIADWTIDGRSVLIATSWRAQANLDHAAECTRLARPARRMLAHVARENLAPVLLADLAREEHAHALVVRDIRDGWIKVIEPVFADPFEAATPR